MRVVTILFYCAFCVAISVADLAGCQDQLSLSELSVASIFKANSESLISFRAHFDPNRGLTVDSTERIFPPDYFCGFFEDQAVLEELDLVDFQRKDYLNAVEDFRERIEQDGFGTVAPDGLNQSQPVKELLDSLESFLIERQLDALAQIQLRFLSRRVGIDSILRSELVKEFAGLTAKDNSTISSNIVSKRPELEKKLVEAFYKEFGEDTLDVFNETDRNKILSKWECLDASKPSLRNIETIRLNFAIWRHIKGKANSNLKNFSLKEYVERLPALEYDITGNFRAVDIDNLSVESVMAVQIKSLIDDNPAAIELALSDDQLIQLVETKERFKLKERQVESKYQREFDGLPRDARFDRLVGEVKENYRTRLAEVEVEFVNEAQVIFGRQWNGFESLVKEGLVRKLGLFVDIETGPLSRSLPGGTNELEKFMSRMEHALDEYGRASMEVEDWWIETVCDSCDDGKKRKIRQLFGEQTKHSTASFLAYLRPFE
ncbi:MAG: hypothetical protein ACK49R_07960 [Planctomycetota bacterium]